VYAACPSFKFNDIHGIYPSVGVNFPLFAAIPQRVVYQNNISSLLLSTKMCPPRRFCGDSLSAKSETSSTIIVSLLKSTKPFLFLL
jgi:hypothetical protein